MRSRMIPLTVPNLTGREKEYLDNCIDTTYVSSVGGYVTRLEEMVAKTAGATHAVATSAGTTGLHAALTAVNVRAGDLVVMPTFTFIATANAVAHCGAVPWLMDIKASDWCLDPGQVRSELEKECKTAGGKVFHSSTGRRVAAIMPVYTLGNVPDMGEFRTIAEDFGLPLIADAACAIGAKSKGKSFGSLADASVLSFNGNKTVTCGGGGAVAGSNPKLMDLIRHIATTARCGGEYDFDMVGYNYRMTNIQAAVGCAQMERIEEFISRKKQIRDYYASAFAGLDGIASFPTADGSSCWLSGIVLPEDRDIGDVRSLAEKLKARGIESRTFWKPVHLQKPYADAPRSDVRTAEKLWGRVVTLPCSTNITDSELSYVAESVKDIYKGL